MGTARRGVGRESHAHTGTPLNVCLGLRSDVAPPDPQSFYDNRSPSCLVEGGRPSAASLDEEDEGLSHGCAMTTVLHGAPGRVYSFREGGRLVGWGRPSQNGPAVDTGNRAAASW